MRTFTKLFQLIFIAAVLFFAGCKKNNSGGDAVAFGTLKNHLELIGMDFNHVLNSAENVNLLKEIPADGNLSDKWIMDIRNISDYVDGHIQDAHQAQYKDVLVAAIAADKPILVVDYTGEVASYVAALLRLYGYPDTQAMKWGMSGWNEQFDIWTLSCKDLTDDNNWTTEKSEAGSFGSPVFATTASDGDAMLKERVEAVFAAGYKGLVPAEVLANRDNYRINNYVPANDYEGFGHIQGAVNVYPLSLNNLDKMDPGNKIATYSYSGHISAAVTAYLNVLGYDAWNVKYGLNGMSVSNPYWTSGNVSGHWGFDVSPKNFPFVSGNE